MITCPSLKGYREAAEITSVLLDMAVKDAEKYGYTQFFWVTSTKGWNRREQFWYNYSDTFKRYNVFIENVIPAGEEPKFDYEKLLWVIVHIPQILQLNQQKLNLIYSTINLKNI